MEKVISSSIFSTEGGTRQMNMCLLRWVPHLAVEKSGKATREMSGTGNGRSRPLTPAESWKYFGIYNSIKPPKSTTERGLSLPTIMRQDLPHLTVLRSFAIHGNRRLVMPYYALGYAAILGQYFSIGDRKLPTVSWKEASWEEFWVIVFSPRRQRHSRPFLWRPECNISASKKCQPFLDVNWSLISTPLTPSISGIKLKKKPLSSQFCF